MAPTRALRARDRQRATEGADCEHSHGESGDLRRPAHPGGTRRTRGALRAQARGAAHATGGGCPENPRRHPPRHLPPPPPQPPPPPPPHPGRHPPFSPSPPPILG